jgi:signal transduction histidine kinase
VTVADNGSGMSAETRLRLFEPFYSTKGERGTGLGLWVSRGILEKHKAKVRVKSSQGPVWRGTVFRVFFPWENGL